MKADKVACAGAGICAVTAPDVFGIGEDFQVIVLNAHPDSSLSAEVEAAVLYCPHQALTASTE
ncbi:ferredoxin [Rhodococcoides fascians]|uniref:ferredoxin n=1 Tax=Nocardiaceae TaxID=85025 RepID=UPI000A7BA637